MTSSQKERNGKVSEEQQLEKPVVPNVQAHVEAAAENDAVCRVGRKEKEKEKIARRKALPAHGGRCRNK